MRALATYFCRVFVVVSIVLSAGCGSKDAPASTIQDDLVALGELPLSLRATDAAPTNAAKIEIGNAEMRVDGTKLLTLDHGRVPDGEVAQNVITKLKNALSTGAARRVAAIHVHSVVPWKTTAQVLATLAAANMHDAAFRVRRQGTETGWLAINGFQLAANADDEASFPNVTRLGWSDFGNAWEAVNDACLAVSEPLNCTPKPDDVAPDGNLQIVLRAHGDGGIKLEFYRVGAPVAQAEAAHAVARPRMIEGVRAPPPAAPRPEDQVQPATEAQYTLRQDAATTTPSPISAMMRPLCGSRACGVVLVGDADAMSMRPLSLIGAAFPEGAAAPNVAVVVPH